jgi:hypothetical protein
MQSTPGHAFCYSALHHTHHHYESCCLPAHSRDEPTSGLDSEMALNVMDTLLSLARRNRTVVCTIHQPNSDITSLFDDLMLLAAVSGVRPGVVTWCWKAA